MNPKPLVSVLMGIYNCADTLEEAVDSILAQTYTNWELIMCDDCSTDNTLEVAKKIAQKDSRIVVINNDKNLTLAPTLNNCLKIAKGEYVARMDGDDICDPTRFEKELNFLQQNQEFALVSTRMNMYDENGVFGVTTAKDYPCKEDLLKGPPFCHAGCMMKKSVLDQVNGYNTDKSVERVEDYDLWFRIYTAGYKGANLQEALYSMRDDRNAVKRRKMKYRINSFNIKRRVIKEFNLPKINYIFTIRPILLGLCPIFLYKFLHQRKQRIK